MNTCVKDFYLVYIYQHTCAKIHFRNCCYVSIVSVPTVRNTFSHCINELFKLTKKWM